jgi:hypothetical protein
VDNSDARLLYCVRTCGRHGTRWSFSEHLGQINHKFAERIASLRMKKSAINVFGGAKIEIVVDAARDTTAHFVSRDIAASLRR